MKLFDQVNLELFINAVFAWLCKTMTWSSNNNSEQELVRRGPQTPVVIVYLANHKLGWRLNVSEVNVNLQLSGSLEEK